MGSSVSSSILFHCWRGDDRVAARRILKSICKKGLLLTTNAATLDSFAIDRGNGVIQMEVMQRPRVCLTDIPIALLAEHGQRYGKYGVGFRRETIINWGGLAVGRFGGRSGSLKISISQQGMVRRPSSIRSSSSMACRARRQSLS
jgi:hypothetical protein